MKNFPVDVWWPVYEARTAHFAVFGVSGVVHQRVYRRLGHGGMSPQRCWTRARDAARVRGREREEDEVVTVGRGYVGREVAGEGDEGQRGRALRAVSAPRGPRG